MVLYFSGTGNSQLAAKQIAEELSDELVSVNRCLKDGEKREFHSDLPLVFVAPVYARRLCEKAGLTYCGLASVQMPENYIALSSAPSEIECEQMIARAEPVFSALAQHIKQGEPFAEAPVSLGGRFLSGPFNPLYYSLAIHDKGFTVSDSCVSCGKCARRCPLNNISLAGGKPQWNGSCTHCMACICGCPVEAIEYKSISKGKRRYYIMDDELCWGKRGNIN